MSLLLPFKALRPEARLVERVSCVNYDVVSRKEARELAGDEPYNFLRVVRADIEYPDSVEPDISELSERSKQNFLKLINENIFIQDPNPGYYVYRQIWKGRTQLGLVACAPVDAYRDGRIKRHEKTRAAKEEEVTAHIYATGAHTSPVFMIHRDYPELDSILSDITGHTPVYDFTCEEDVRHTLWLAPDNERIANACANINELYVADGHHRAASACRCQDMCRENNPQHTGREAYNYFLVVSFPHSQTQILPYNRIVLSLGGYSTEEFLNKLEPICSLKKSSITEPSRTGTCAMYIDNSWYRLELPQALNPEDPISRLDVTRLYDHILSPLLKISDPRTDKNIDFVGGIRGLKELERLVNSNQAAVAFAMYPTSVDSLLEISDMELIMAPKSTWFEPKVRTGIFIHQFTR